MATNNFHNVNASLIFAVLMSYTYEDDETGEEVEYNFDDDDVDILKEGVLERMHETGIETFNYGYSQNELRSYGADIIGSFRSDKYFGDVLVRLTCTALIRYAYYDGANLDWEINYEVGEHDFQEDKPSKQEIIDEIIYYSDMPVGMQKIQSKYMEAFINKESKRLSTKMEEVFACSSGTKLKQLGSLSNGEGVYTAVE